MKRKKLSRVRGRPGTPAAAILACCERLERQPANPALLMQLGEALEQAGHAEEAAAAYRHSLARAPQAPQAWWRLANVLHRMGHWGPAADAYETVLALAPRSPEALYNLGVTRMLLGSVEQARDAYQGVLALSPHHASALNNLGNLEHGAGRWQTAESYYREAVRRAPERADSRYNLARLLQDQDRVEEASRAYEDILRRWPEDSDAQNNLGNLLLSLAQPEPAIERYRRALRSRPDLAEARWNEGLAHLLLGDYERGWEGYEWRFRQPGARPRAFVQPSWDGSSLDGRTILLHAEQGLGDTLQFVRFAPLVAARGGRVVLEVQRPLVNLLQTAQGVDGLVAAGDGLPAFDVHAPLLSVPRLLGTRLSAVPHGVPYVAADAGLISRFQALVDRAAGPRMLKVGLVWAGNPGHRNDRHRSMPLAALAPLGQLPQCRFFSLQKGAAHQELASVPPGFAIVDLADHLLDFAHTAAAIVNLDLVVSVDTSVAHLTGALGRPVWLLLPFAPDWRWLLRRGDSPWYPTMRLFRQPRRGDWPDVVEQIESALSDYVRR